MCRSALQKLPAFFSKNITALDFISTRRLSLKAMIVVKVHSSLLFKESVSAFQEAYLQ